MRNSLRFLRACLVVCFLALVPQMSAASPDEQSDLEELVRSRGRRETTLKRFGPEGINAVAERLLDGTVIVDRGDMVLTLGGGMTLLHLSEQTKARCVEALRVALKDPDAYVRFVSAQIVAKAVPEMASSLLVERLHDPDQKVRIESLYVLGGYGDATAMESIRRVIEERSKGRTEQEIEADATIRFARIAVKGIETKTEKEKTAPSKTAVGTNVIVKEPSGRADDGEVKRAVGVHDRNTILSNGVWVVCICVGVAAAWLLLRLRKSGKGPS